MVRNLQPYEPYKPSNLLTRLLHLGAVLTLAVSFQLSAAFTPAVLAGTPGDSYTIGRYYAESNAESTYNTNTSFQDKTTLTFTPRGSGSQYYLLIASALVANSSTSYYTEAQFLQDAATLAIEQYRPSGSATTNYITFGAQKIVTLTAGTSYTFKIQYRTNNASGTAKIKNARIVALQVTNYSNNVAESNTNTTSTSYVDKVALTFNASATDYLIVASADYSNANTGQRGKARVYDDTGAAVQGEMLFEPPASLLYRTFNMMRKASLTAGSKTYSIEYATTSSSSGKETYSQNARISAILLSDLGTNSYAESETETSTTSTSYVDKATLSFTPSAPGDYLIIASAFTSPKNASDVSYANLDIGGTSYAEMVFRPKDSTDYMPFFSAVKVNLAAAAQTIKIQYKQTGGTAYMRNARLIAIRLDTMESYSDSGYNTKSDSFSAVGASMYVRGMGYTASGSYRIAYYDAGASGGQWLKNTDTSSSAAGELTDTTLVPSNYPSAAAGSWRAVVSSQSYSPPQNYTDYSAAQKIAEDTFTINASALPELPTTLAGITAVTLCLAGYWWMRRRRQRVVAG